MSSTSFINLRVHNAEQFKEAISEPAPNTKIYLAIGKVDAWANDAVPANANSSIAMSYEIWDNMIGGKRMVGSDISHVIPRFDWEANTTYMAYDHMNDHLFDGDDPFYIKTSQNGVYKCISNNNGQASTVEPSSFNVNSPISLADGYIWKYMYTISSSELLRFTTDEYIPVKTLSSDDGSQQWDVQNNARDGSIEHIEMIDHGSGYSNASNIVITVTGDGTSVIALANVSNNQVEKILVTDPGVGFTQAQVSISGGGGSGATARAIISPPGGHGFNSLYELGGRIMLIDGRLRYDEEGVLPTTNDYRQVSLIKDPVIKATNNVATQPAFSQMMEITTSGVGSYDQNEIVYQGGSLATASFTGRVVYYDPNTSKVYLINTKGAPTASRSLIGSESFAARVLASVSEEEVRKNSGSILYVDNIVPVMRSEDQIEDFKIVINF